MVYEVYKFTDSRLLPMIIQGIFKNKKDAEKFLKELNKKGEDGFIKEVKE